MEYKMCVFYDAFKDLYILEGFVCLASAKSWARKRGYSIMRHSFKE
jgi:hypothetical protein